MSGNELVGIYLAAGRSKRMGEDKLALPLGDFPLGAVALKKALRSKLNRMIIVINDKQIPSWLAAFLPLCSDSEKFHIVVCQDAGEGISRSIRAGILEASAVKAQASMILLADQPMITTEMVNAIIEAYQLNKKQNPEIRYAASSIGNVVCPPILFSNEVFPELLCLEGDTGAKQILNRMTGITIEFHEQSLFYDVDSKAQYEELLTRFYAGYPFRSSRSSTK